MTNTRHRFCAKEKARNWNFEGWFEHYRGSSYLFCSKMHLHVEIWNNWWSAPEYNLKDVKSTNASVVRLQRLVIQSLYFRRAKTLGIFLLFLRNELLLTFFFVKIDYLVFNPKKLLCQRTFVFRVKSCDGGPGFDGSKVGEETEFANLHCVSFVWNMVAWWNFALWF